MGQRVSQIAGGYEEANDANLLGKDSWFKMGGALLKEDPDLARAATSRDFYRSA